MLSAFQKNHRLRIFAALAVVVSFTLPIASTTCAIAWTLSGAGEAACHEEMEVPVETDLCHLADSIAEIDTTHAAKDDCCHVEQKSVLDETILTIRSEADRLFLIAISYMQVYLIEPAIEFATDLIKKLNLDRSTSGVAVTVLHQSFLL